jgi:hypothetical protein
MSGRNIGDLPIPPKAYRVDIGEVLETSGFESLAASRREDALRASGLSKAAAKHPDAIKGDEAAALVGKLDRAANGAETPETLASSVHLRGFRIRVVGAIWQLVVGVIAVMKVCAFTVIPATLEFSPDELDGVDPRRLIAGLRTALYGKGAGEAKGWLIAFLHGEHDPVGGVYRLHMHGLAAGEMVQVVDKLRELPNYKTQRLMQDGSLSPVYRRVRIERKSLVNLPAVLSYLLQSFWPSRAVLICDEGKRIRARRKQRIVEPYHSQVLLWLDRWNLADLTLMIGLRVTKDGLKQTKPVS